ncbi:Gfo/Idh/MocA family protein [Paenibacillus humicola]|uniref:Gfo/Idh/MocA family protein n=1 Tax=Paenibacillus humicola TaxID=3110540 RepID=UPI00237A2357|nr:Gfo/Idh/MocA family oxidoreductase [Paenibacillus humicola]
MSGTIRMAVVGLGRVSKSHLPALRELSPKLRLAALVSRDAEKLRREAGNEEDVKTYTSYADMLENEEIDAVLLLLPHHLHAEYSIRALRAGKHVLVEKPMAMNSAEAEAMEAAADVAGRVLMIGQSRRFFTSVMESVRRLREGAIGRLININALLLAHMDKPAADWWTDPDKIGGFIVPLWGSHILDYIVWAYGETPESVYAQGFSNNPHWRGEDEAAISLRFAGGRMANVLMSFNAGSRPTDEEGLTGKRIWSTQNGVYDRYLIGTNGMMRLKDEYELEVNGAKEAECGRDAANFRRQLEEFADAILEGRQPLASGREVLPVVRVIDAVFESMRTNRVVRLNGGSADNGYRDEYGRVTKYES